MYTRTRKTMGGGAIETMLYKMFQEKGRAPPGFKSLTRGVITNTQEGVYHLHFTSYWSGLSAWCMKIFSFYFCVCVGGSLYICATVRCPKGTLQCHSTGTLPIVFESGSLSGLELTGKPELPCRQIPRIESRPSFRLMGPPTYP